MEQERHRACEWTKLRQKVTSHSNWSRVLLFDFALKQCNGITKGWFHCLKSDSKGRFLVNNILMFGSAWCLVMVQIQFSLIKKDKDWMPKTLANPPPSTSENISFFCYLKWTSYVYHPLLWIFFFSHEKVVITQFSENSWFYPNAIWLVLKHEITWSWNQNFFDGKIKLFHEFHFKEGG